MKRMNNKGFTLVELLAVLVILITILTIAIPSITSSVERNKQNILKKKIDIIEVAAESYVNMYKNKFQSFSSFSNGYCCVNIVQISGVGMLDSDDLKDANGKDIDGYVCYESNEYKYYDVDSGKSGCAMKS